MFSFPNLSSLYLLPALALLSQQSLSPLAFWPGVSVMYRTRDYVANRLHPEGSLTFLTLTNPCVVRKYDGQSVSLWHRLLKGTVTKKPLNKDHNTACLVIQCGVTCRSFLKLKDLSYSPTLTKSHLLLQSFWLQLKATPAMFLH